MSLQLENVATQVKDYMESLAYSGLNLVSKDNIKKIEFFLQNTSQLKAFRLATSLRYLHIELKRFLNNRAAFNIERYVFFLSNSWLLSRAFSQKTLKEEKPTIFDELMGTRSIPKIMTKLILRVVGIERIHLEGTLVGFIFYFLSLFGKTRGKILTWNQMIPYKSGITAENVLLNELPNSEPSAVIDKLLSHIIEADNIYYSKKDNVIFLEKQPDFKKKIYPKIYIEEGSDEDTQLIISKLNNFYNNSKEIYKKLQKAPKVTPFDLPVSFLDYLYVKEVKIVEAQKLGQHGDITPAVLFKLLHKEDYPLTIKIPEKRGNQKLIDKLMNLKGRNNPLEGLFCKLFLDNGQLTLYPLSIISNNEIIYPNLLKDNKKLLKTSYKVK